MNSIIPKKPGDMACLDLMGPFPPSRGGVIYLLVIMDAFTKYTKLYSLRRATTSSILRRLLGDYFTNILKPLAILTDNGTQFHSKHWQKCLADCDIKILHTSVYFPQGNPTERVNKEIGRLLRALCFSKHSKWACVLVDVERCINIIIDESTGYAPAYLLKGKVKQNCIKTLINFPTDNTDSDPTEISLSTVWELAHATLISKSQKRQHKHNTEHKPTIFIPGELVLMKSHNLSSPISSEIKKLFLLYEGPYTIQKQVGPNSYILEGPQGIIPGTQNIIN